MPCTCPFSTTMPAYASHQTVSRATHSANTRREQHEDRQQRRSIDDHEDDEHRQQRDDEQQSVDAEEALDEVGGEAGRPGHPALEIARQLARRPSCGSPPRRPAPRRTSRSARRSAPPRRLPTRSAARPLPARRRCRRSRRSGSEAPRASSSVSALSPVTTTTAGMVSLAEEVGQPLAHLRRIGTLRQERRLVVRRDLVDLAEVRTARSSRRSARRARAATGMPILSQREGCRSDRRELLHIASLSSEIGSAANP